ncbi:Cofilin [Smittium mucronatum]|uniref:Cofilin n=1 Tax=Smittium mucronatum TaxID=133383 RepID=A0A1R0H5I7_9FUNG|nr:Cofilin [Smittium mucronatum]
MSSGISVNDECISTFHDLKLKKAHKYAIFKINDARTEIVLDKVSSSTNYEEFVNALPTDDCRFAVYDFSYEVEGAGTRHKLCFYIWYFFLYIASLSLFISFLFTLILILHYFETLSRSPDTAKIRPKMLYASSKDAIRKRLDGINNEIQCTDLDEVSHKSVLEKVSRVSH